MKHTALQRQTCSAPRYGQALPCHRCTCHQTIHIQHLRLHQAAQNDFHPHLHGLVFQSVQTHAADWTINAPSSDSTCASTGQLHTATDLRCNGHPFIPCNCTHSYHLLCTRYRASRRRAGLQMSSMVVFCRVSFMLLIRSHVSTSQQNEDA